MRVIKFFHKLNVLLTTRTNIENLASRSLADVARRAVCDGEAKTIRRNRPCLGRILAHKRVFAAGTPT